MRTDALLDLLAAHLDELEAMAARYQRIGMTGTAARLRAVRDRLEERVTEPEGEGDDATD